MMTIQELYLLDAISTKGLNTCTANKIETIFDLIEYYDAHDSFIFLKNCGLRTNSELVRLCLKFKDSNNEFANIVYRYSNKNILEILSNFDENKLLMVNNFIKSIFDEQKARICKAFNFFLLGDVTIKGFENKVFRDGSFVVNKIKDIGILSIPEVRYFVKEIRTYILELSEGIKVTEIEEKFEKEKNIRLEVVIERLNEEQKRIINNYIMMLTDALSERSRNAVKFYLDSEPNVNVLKEKVFSISGFDFLSLKRVGVASIVEVTKYFHNIEVIIKEVFEKFEDSNIPIPDIGYFLKTIHKDIDVEVFLDKHKTIFSIVDGFINSHFFNERDMFILKSLLKVNKNATSKTLVEVAKEINISKERVRQKKNVLFDKLNSSLQFLRNYDKTILSSYKIDINGLAIIIDDETVDYINSIEGTDFSVQYITFIVSKILQDEFVIVGNLEEALMYKWGKSRSRYVCSGLYLVRKDIVENFDIDKFVADVYYMTTERIDKTIIFPFKTYLSKFIKGKDSTIIDKVFLVCEKILGDKFDLYLSSEKEIVFERRTAKLLSEYAYEALEILGKPSHISEIKNLINKLKPGHKHDVKINYLKKKFGFISFSRTGFYGLKKWEVESDIVKGGSIRAIAEELLMKHDVPLHREIICEHVLKYRPTSNKNSIIYNLQMMNPNRFVFFENQLIGVTGKKYDETKYVKFVRTEKKEKKTWDENYKLVSDFVALNKRLPLSGNSKEELKLYRWLIAQISRLNDDKFEEEKKQLIQEIVSEYKKRIIKPKPIKKVPYTGFGYIKLTEFIMKEKRLPVARKLDERKLYFFYREQRKYYNAGRLDANEESNFIEVNKLIEIFCPKKVKKE